MPRVSHWLSTETGTGTAESAANIRPQLHRVERFEGAGAETKHTKLVMSNAVPVQVTGRSTVVHALDCLGIVHRPSL